MVTRLALGLVCFLLSTHTVVAEFTAECRRICLDPFDQNILLTECTVDGSAKDNRFNDGQFQWSEFDLNQILAFSNGHFEYQQKGLIFANGSPCQQCFVDEHAVLICLCGGSTPVVDLNQNLFDVVGGLCFVNAYFGPICGKATARRC
ncbi:hypothetical protein SEPCBS119000_003763 [Sporothrix epigloea]|uniref:Cyanovirin-N domain-containing protein n=1 Tax=Sporothrix epigloea TaxID=1892477 RepID=A0ABP0DNE5_9PEZI